VIQDHDSVRREVDVGGDVRLAVVADVGVTAGGGGIQAEAVVGGLAACVRARRTVAVADVDEDVRAGERSADAGPGGVRAVQLDDVGAKAARDRGEMAAVRM